MHKLDLRAGKLEPVGRKSAIYRTIKMYIFGGPLVLWALKALSKKFRKKFYPSFKF